MRFKTKKIERDWNNYISPYQKRNEKLKKFVGLLEDISELVGGNPIVITDYLRYGQKNIHSLHHEVYGCAVDIRVRNQTPAWYFMMTLIGMALALVDPKVRMNAHYEIYKTNNCHIHLEVRA